MKRERERVRERERERKNIDIWHTHIYTCTRRDINSDMQNNVRTYTTYTHSRTFIHTVIHDTPYKDFLYSLILYLYINVTSIVRSAPSFTYI